MNESLEVLEKLLAVGDEVVFPAIAIWLCYLLRRWLRGELKPPASKP